MIIKIDPVKKAEKIRSEYTALVQKHLDDFAKTRGYTNCLFACTYAASTNPKFQKEGLYKVEKRDETWEKCYRIIHEVESGLRPIPTIEELFSELPILKWPAA